MRLYFVRHGETINNKQHVFNGGSVDPVLTEMGQQEAQRLGNYLADVKFDRCFSSPLKRAYSTAQIVLEENHLTAPKIEIMQALTEMNLGDWDGKAIKDVHDEAQLKNYFETPADFDAATIHAESYQEVQQRGEQVVKKICQMAVGKGSILIASHGLFLNTVLKTLDGVPLNEIRKDGLLPTSSVTTFDVNADHTVQLIEWGVKPGK